MIEGRWATYEDYLSSSEWAERREACLRRAANRCQMCNDTATQAHHRTYERIGRELESDLTALCHGCHQNFHAHRDLVKAPSAKTTRKRMKKKAAAETPLDSLLRETWNEHIRRNPAIASMIASPSARETLRSLTGRHPNG